MSRLVFGFMWLVHFLPFARARGARQRASGAVVFWLIAERRQVTRINLAKCFPQMPPRERERSRARTSALSAARFFERGILWWAPRERIERAGAHRGPGAPEGAHEAGR